VKELRALVQEKKEMPIPEPIGGSPNLIKRMILFLWTTICHLMGCKRTSEEDVHKADCLIRMFLLTVKEYDEATRTHLGREIPIWISQYNFMCLLNIPGQMRLLGPIRNRWEGSQRGEGFLRHVKPIIQSNRKNWNMNLLTNLLRQKTLSFMANDDEKSTQNNENNIVHPPSHSKFTHV